MINNHAGIELYTKTVRRPCQNVISDTNINIINVTVSVQFYLHVLNIILNHCGITTKLDNVILHEI